MTMAQVIPHTNLGTVDVEMEISSDLGYHAGEDIIDIDIVDTDIDFSEEPMSRVDDAFMIDDRSLEVEATSNQFSSDTYDDDEMTDGDGTSAAHENLYPQDEEFRDRSVDGEGDVAILEEDEIVIGSGHYGEANAIHIQESEQSLSNTEKLGDSASTLQNELGSNNQMSESQDQIEARLKIASSDEHIQQPPEQEHVQEAVYGADLHDEDGNEFDIDDQHSFQQETPYSADKMGLGEQEKYPGFIESTTAVHAPQQLQAVDGLSKTPTLVSNHVAPWVHRPAAEAEINQVPHHGLSNGGHQGGPLLHPVIVIYEDNEIYLFPPKNQDASNTYFLEDESLAASSMKELFGACRTVLGQSINDDLELELDVAELGLTLSEDSPYSETSNLISFLDLYLQLCRHDRIEAPGPLFVTLSTRNRYIACLTRLTDAVKEGKGLSQLHMLNGYNHSDESLEEIEADTSVGDEQGKTEVGEEFLQNAAVPSHHANHDPSRKIRYLDSPEFGGNEPAYPDANHETAEPFARMEERTDGETIAIPGEQDEAEEIQSQIDVNYDAGESHEDDLIDFEGAEDDENAFTVHQGEDANMLSTDNSTTAATAQYKRFVNDASYLREDDLDDTGENVVLDLQVNEAIGGDALDQPDVDQVDYDEEDNLDNVDGEDSSQLENVASTAPVSDDPLVHREPSDQVLLAQYEQPESLIFGVELEESVPGSKMVQGNTATAKKRSNDHDVHEQGWENEDVDVTAHITVNTDTDGPRVACIPKDSLSSFTANHTDGKGALDASAPLPRQQFDGVEADLQQAQIVTMVQPLTRTAPIVPKSLSKKRSWIEHKEGDHGSAIAMQVKKPRSASD